MKEDLLAGKLGGNRQDFWQRMKSEGIGLITFAESEVDQIENIGEEEAKVVRSKSRMMWLIVVFRMI